jgi:hypothetical protein
MPVILILETCIATLKVITTQTWTAFPSVRPR